ncbi:DUF3060 domain-containing protein [bacterium]|nr:DUF3060 domain-containing protein [bacterium]
MRKTTVILMASLALLGGCSTPETNSSAERATTTETTERAVPSVTQNKSTVVSVEANGNKRTDGTYQSAHSDENGARASVQVHSQKSDASGSTSSRDKVLKVSSEGEDATSLGFTQDDKNVGVTGSNVTKEFNVDGQDVAVSGSGNTLTFKGKTHGLSVTGNDNHIQVENAQMLDVNGENNQVIYTGTKPEITQAGQGNQVNPQ